MYIWKEKNKTQIKQLFNELPENKVPENTVFAGEEQVVGLSRT